MAQCDNSVSIRVILFSKCEIAYIASLQPTPIKFPNTADEIKATQLGVYNIACFLLVVPMEYGLHTGK